MSTSELEIELRRWRQATRRHRSEPGPPPTGAPRLTNEEAFAYRERGNLPDSKGRTLRLVLAVDGAEDLHGLGVKRAGYEPDYHARPTWRRPGSKPVNVVPLRPPGTTQDRAEPWWEQPELAALEKEWERRGTVAGVTVPGEYRGFVFKTVLALRASGVAPSPDAIADSVARWVSPEIEGRIRAALRQADGSSSGP